MLRLIEFMDAGTSNVWPMDEVVSALDILDRMAVQFPLEPLDPNYTGDVARRGNPQQKSRNILHQRVNTK